ncbi:hypothetical protein [Candidatus Protochlamydia phocaeensis]|uniref:hypothetical protein n=1 Tax=Candidatus Protochlamydia phocaeensis TaxID=1414722 RepID=UPI0008387054|nr:hypothetical protein [Candidatus Protochlamydia phocaeensis]
MNISNQNSYFLPFTYAFDQMHSPEHNWTVEPEQQQTAEGEKGLINEACTCPECAQHALSEQTITQMSVPQTEQSACSIKELDPTQVNHKKELKRYIREDSRFLKNQEIFISKQTCDAIINFFPLLGEIAVRTKLAKRLVKLVNSKGIEFPYRNISIEEAEKTFQRLEAFRYSKPIKKGVFNFRHPYAYMPFDPVNPDQNPLYQKYLSKMQGKGLTVSNHFHERIRMNAGPQAPAKIWSNPQKSLRSWKRILVCSSTRPPIISSKLRTLFERNWGVYPAKAFMKSSFT